VLILQVPSEVYYSVGRCAGHGLEREAIRRLAFHNKLTVGFRQLEQERRAESRVKLGGVIAELAEVANYKRQWRSDDRISAASRARSSAEVEKLN
jgi:hypothetical protein